MTMDRIGLNQFFMVRDPKTNVVTEMMYPGDVGTALNNIPASEVVNCRCVMATEALKDDDGLPILKPRTPDYLRKLKEIDSE
jgi:hypothetical protein